MDFHRGFTGTGTTAPCTVIGFDPVNDQLTAASLRFPVEPLASALPPRRVLSVPPVFAQVPVKPVYPVIVACGQTSCTGEERNGLTLVPFWFALCIAKR